MDQIWLVLKTIKGKYAAFVVFWSCEENTYGLILNFRNTEIDKKKLKQTLFWL